MNDERRGVEEDAQAIWRACSVPGSLRTLRTAGAGCGGHEELEHRKTHEGYWGRKKMPSAWRISRGHGSRRRKRWGEYCGRVREARAYDFEGGGPRCSAASAED